MEYSVNKFKSLGIPTKDLVELKPIKDYGDGGECEPFSNLKFSKKPSKYDIIIPGSTEWLIASPINDHPLSTKKHESRAAGTDMIAAIMKAFIIKLYWNGVTNMSAIISVCF